MAVRLGLIGYPVSQSLSPAFQQPALDALGIDATYELWPTPPEDVPARVASLREPDVLGANVTVPHKEAVALLVDELSDQGKRAGAVNTVINRSGTLFAENTDITGLARSLRESGLEVPGFDAVVLGAGGAARGALLALEMLGVASITISNRNQARAAELMTVLPNTDCMVTGLNGSDVVAALNRADLVLNTTSVGWKTGESPIAPELLRALPGGAVVFDLTYRETLLLATARELGLQAVDGLAMLVYQGAHALELWTGKDAPVDLMMAHALAARAAAS